MRILKIAPIYIPLSPNLKYGGIERVVLALARSFSEKRHEVLVAAPSDSSFSNEEGRNFGTLLPTLPQSEWNKPRFLQDPKAYEKHVRKVIEYAENVRPDIIHDHTGNFVLSNSFRESSQDSKVLQETPIVATPHEFQRFRKMSPPQQKNIVFTVLSEYQRTVFSKYVNVKEVINNGVFLEDYPFNYGQRKSYLFSLGSIEEDKGQDLAVRVALESGMPLELGGSIADQRFYDLEIDPFMRIGRVKYLGPLDDKEKTEHYSHATASIIPIRIGDCFSLVRIESLACGTPVITLDTGSAREAVLHKKTGYVIPFNSHDEDSSVQMMKDALVEIKNGSINPHHCRKDVEERFDWKQISDKYIRLYENIINKQ